MHDGALARPSRRAHIRYAQHARRGTSPTVREGSRVRAMRDFDYNEFPLAYLITFRCYGTWLHGDQRGSYRRNPRLSSGVSYIPPRPGLERAESKQLKHAPIRLTNRQRTTVEQAVSDVCTHRRYQMHAINIRTNHAHSVVSAFSYPEPILDAFKSYSTRALRAAGLLSAKVKPWARHGSTFYLWKERDVEKAVEYVLLGQDHEFSLD
jgi:REP element-mobilizing transposase RayT